MSQLDLLLEARAMQKRLTNRKDINLDRAAVLVDEFTKAGRLDVVAWITASLRRTNIWSRNDYALSRQMDEVRRARFLQQLIEQSIKANRKEKKEDLFSRQPSPKDEHYDDSRPKTAKIKGKGKMVE